MRMNILDICRLLDVVCVGMRPETALSCPTGAAIDSRAVKPGDLFFCLPGERTDGHDFARAALDNGAVAVIGARDPFEPGETTAPVLVVDDPAEALNALAAAHRRTTKALVVGVTGTAGKTSVKDALACVLAESGETAKTHMNFNNQLGLPLSVLNASASAAYWVIEAGISRPRDMDELGSTLRPDATLIVNAGAGHVEELGDKGVAHYKARLLGYMPRTGRGVICADYPDLVREAQKYDAEMMYFSGKDADALFYAVYLGPDGTRGRYRLFLEGADVEVSAPFQGGFGAENVAAVGATAHILGLTAPEIVNGFARAQTPDRRFTLRELGPHLVIDDSYNANPLSMGRMLEAADDMAAERGRALALVLGEMGELGEESDAFHENLGRRVCQFEPEAVFWKGGRREAFARGLAAGGYAGKAAFVDNAAAFVEAMQTGFPDSAVVLFKGSRSNKLEELVAAFAASVEFDDTAKGRRDAL